MGSWVEAPNHLSTLLVHVFFEVHLFSPPCTTHYVFPETPRDYFRHTARWCTNMEDSLPSCRWQVTSNSWLVNSGSKMSHKYSCPPCGWFVTSQVKVTAPHNKATAMYVRGLLAWSLVSSDDCRCYGLRCCDFSLQYLALISCRFSRSWRLSGSFIEQAGGAETYVTCVWSTLLESRPGVRVIVTVMFRDYPQSLRRIVRYMPSNRLQPPYKTFANNHLLENVVLIMGFLQVLRFRLVSISPPVLHAPVIHSFIHPPIHHRRHIFSTTYTIVK
jgi:hypothetical protein